MFKNRVRLFKLLGFEVKADVSWLLIVLIITWSLASGFFPKDYPGMSTASYWWMGLAAALGLFASVVFHEMSHSLVARSYGIPISGITLWIFGGVAEMTEEPPSAKSEFWMAIAGPLSSVFLGGVCYLLSSTGILLAAGAGVEAVVKYLGWINLMLAGFNMLPAFPLDGGRVLRAFLWNWKKSLRQATRISARFGSGFGMAMIVFGVMAFITGQLVAGIWWFILGMFLRGAATGSYQQLLMRRVLEGEPVSKFMQTNVVTVPGSSTLLDLVENYIYRFHYKMFPVLDSRGDLLGCVTINQVRNVDRQNWETTTVGELAKSCNLSQVSVKPETDAMDTLAVMTRHRISRMMVIADNRLVGVISLKDLMSFIALKLDLEK